MTVANTERRTSAVGTNTVGQEIPFSFPIKDTSDLSCFQRITATGVQTTLAETTNYTVVIDGDVGGTITLVTAVATSAEFHAVRKTSKTQSLKLVQGGDYNANNIEDAFDKNTRQIIENNEAIENKAITFPETDVSTLTTTLESSVDRASKVVACDSAGNITSIAAVPAGSVAFSTFGTNMAEAADAKAGKIVINLDHVVDIRDYGAVAGASDVTSEVQAAIDAAEAGSTGGIVFFPSGTWNFSAEIDISGTSGIVLTGPQYMGGDVILNYSGSGIFLSMNKGFCKIKNLTFQGPDAAAAGDPDNTDVAILFGVSGNPKRENVISGCVFKDWNIAVKTYGAYCRVEKCDMDNCATYGIYAVSGIENVYRDLYITGESGAYGAWISTSQLATFEGCTMSAMAKGIFVHQAENVGALIIKGCHFEGLTESDVENLDGSSTTLMEGCNSDGVISIASAEIILIANRFQATSTFVDRANSNWTMINNRTIDSSYFTTGAGNLNWLDQNRLGLVAFTAADETPDVNGGCRYSTNNSSAGNITDFDKGWAGQVITLVGDDSGKTTIVNASGKIGLKDRKNFTLLNGDTLSLMYNGTDWWETGRSHNISSSVLNIVCNGNQVVCNENTVVIN